VLRPTNGATAFIRAPRDDDIMEWNCVIFGYAKQGLSRMCICDDLGGGGGVG
jgi:hypothetical protein